MAPKVSSFDASKQLLTLPLESSTIKYTLSLVDSMTGNPLLISSTSTGQGWAIKAVSEDPQNFNFLLTSTGVRCKQRASITGYVSCSAGENW